MAFSNARANANYGKGVHTIDLSIASEEDITEALKTTFASPDYHPPLLPKVAVQVNELIQKPRSTLTDIVAVVQRDPVLATAILKRAQSPAYATKIPPRSLQDAASRLGLRGMRDLVWEVSLKAKVFRHPACNDFMERLFHHSLLVARISALIAAHLRFEHKSVFLLGLLHDIGLLASTVALADASRRGRHKLALDEYAGIFRDFHEEAGASVAKLWGLPEEWVEIIECHHRPVKGGSINSTNAILVVAEAVSTAVGGAIELDRQNLDQPNQEVFSKAGSALGIDAEQVQAFVDKSAAMVGI